VGQLGQPERVMQKRVDKLRIHAKTTTVPQKSRVSSKKSPNHALIAATER
jgi:hypothetical protein